MKSGEGIGRVFKIMTTDFLGNFKIENYNLLAEELPGTYKFM
jgi:hypothetical protein